MANELETVPLEEIIEELGRRTRYFALGLVFPVDEHGDAEAFYWHGGLHGALGVTTMMKARLLRERGRLPKPGESPFEDG